MIQDATVFLAELTTKNANVFYELGLAHAIGKPVVLVSETMGDVPFDLQALRVLGYDKDEPDWGLKLTRRITRSLKETLASPVEAVPGIFRKKVESKAPKQHATVARIEALEQQMKLILSMNHKIQLMVAYARESIWDDFVESARELHDCGTPRDLLEAAIREKPEILEYRARNAPARIHWIYKPPS